MRKSQRQLPEKKLREIGIYLDALSHSSSDPCTKGTNKTRHTLEDLIAFLPAGSIRLEHIHHNHSPPVSMSDLHFTINDSGSGSTIQPHEVPVAGEMDHLPNNNTNGNAETTTERTTFEYVQEQLKASSHPTVVIFHLAFKFLSFALYFFGGAFVSKSGSAADSGANFITLTVIIILLLAADFWVTKNVTGRLLVGLRWWNKVDEDSTTWIFESHEQSDKPKQINTFDKSIFWTALYATPCAWVAMLILAFVRFEINWFLVCIMALALSCSNVYGYYKCSSDQKARFQQLGAQVTQQGAMAVMRSNMLSALTGQNNPPSAASRGQMG